MDKERLNLWLGFGKFFRDRYPDGERKVFIFRVVGLPGDRIRIDKGRVYINGQLGGRLRKVT